MKVHICSPEHNTTINISLNQLEETRLYNKRIGDQIDGSLLNIPNALFEIRGGSSLTGTPMVSGQDTPKRLKLLLKKGDTGFRSHKKGLRKRKSVMGSVVSSLTGTIDVALVRAEDEIKGLTDHVNPPHQLPKRAHKLIKLFNVPAGKNIAHHVREVIKKVNPDAKIPRIRVVYPTSEEKLEKIAARRKEQAARRAEFKKELEAYEAKYGKLNIKSN